LDIHKSSWEYFFEDINFVKEETGKSIEEILERKSLNKLTRKLEDKKSAPQEKKLSKSNLKKEDLIFYKKNNIPFGELEFENQLEKEQGQSRKSRYLKYLKENDRICVNMEKGILLTVEYCGTENKAYARFYDLKEKNIKFWIENFLNKTHKERLF